MPLKTEAFGISNIGFVRTNNEDVWTVIPEKQFFILADGMGGHNAGEVAASMVVESMCQSIQALDDQADVEKTCRFLREAVAEANSQIYEEAHDQPKLAGMGTTLSCFVIKDKFLIYAHVGDSRLYRYRNRLDRLTEDHSLRQNSPHEPPSTLPRNVITRAVGTYPIILPDIGVIPLHPGDLYMLCSDGLSDYVDEKTLSRLLASSLPLEEMGKKLVEAALEKGGNDNITLLLVRFIEL